MLLVEYMTLNERGDNCFISFLQNILQNIFIKIYFKKWVEVYIR